MNDLNWLTRKEKDLPVPRLVFSDMTEFAGLYKPPSGPIEIGHSTLENKNGTIIVSTFDEAVIAPTIAHEFRHHWQYYNFISYDSDITNYYQYQKMYSYNEIIVKYFTNSFSEFDALRFELSYDKLDSLGSWLSLFNNKMLKSLNFRNKIYSY